MKGDLLDGYSEYSNDVERGQDPIFIRGTENIQETYKRRNKSNAERDVGDIRKSGRDGTSSIDEISQNNETKEKYSIDPDVESQMKALNEQYGTKKKGENPVRDIDVPERSSKESVREFFQRWEVAQ